MKISTLKFYALLTSSLFLIDRLSKHIIVYNLPYWKMNAYASIELVFNRGLSFGMFHSDDPFVFMAVNILIGCVIGLLIAHTYHRIKHDQLIIGEIFIFTGAISNVVDRCFYNGVIDFIALSYKNWHFAVFNVADIFIFCGVSFMFIVEYWQSWQKS